MLFKLWYLNSNFALTLGYRYPSLNNTAQEIKLLLAETGIQQMFALESGILGFVIRNTAQGFRNSANDWSPESKFHWQKKSWSSTWDPESTAWNLESKTALDSLAWGDRNLSSGFHLGYALPKNTIIIFNLVYVGGCSYQTDALSINWSTICVIQGS